MDKTTMSLKETNTKIIILTLVVSFLSGILYISFAGADSLFGIANSLISNLLVFLVVFIALIIIHELLHAVGFVFLGGGRWDYVKFGISWKDLMPYASYKAPVTASTYRRAIFLPGLVLGILPLIVGLILDIPFLVGWGFLMFLMAFGDFLVIWMIKNVKSNTYVIDHPTEVGCKIVSPQLARKMLKS